MYIILVCKWQCLYPQDYILIWIYRTQINYITLHNVICGLSGCAVLFHVISGMIFFSPQLVCVKHFSFYKELSEIYSYMYICLHEKYPLFLPDINKTSIVLTDFWKLIKFHENVLSRSQFVPWRWVNEQTDITKLIVSFRNLANALSDRVPIIFAESMKSNMSSAENFNFSFHSINALA